VQAVESAVSYLCCILLLTALYGFECHCHIKMTCCDQPKRNVKCRNMFFIYLFSQYIVSLPWTLSQTIFSHEKRNLFSVSTLLCCNFKFSYEE